MKKIYHKTLTARTIVIVSVLFISLLSFRINAQNDFKKSNKNNKVDDEILIERGTSSNSFSQRYKIPCPVDELISKGCQTKETKADFVTQPESGFNKIRPFDPSESDANSQPNRLANIYDYRTRATGNWSSYSTVWQVRKNGGTWANVTTSNSLSPYYPTTSNANSIEIQSGHTITLNINSYVANTTIDNGGTLTIPYSNVAIGFNSGKTLTNNGTINCNAGGSAYNGWDGYGLILNAGSLINNNMINISSTGVITLLSSGSSIINNLGANITNTSGGVYAIDGTTGSSSSVYGAIYAYPSGGGTTVTNYGTITNNSPAGYFRYSGGKYYFGGEMILNNLNNFGTINNSTNGYNYGNITFFYNIFTNFSNGIFNTSGNINIGGHSISATCLNSGTYNEGWATIVDGGSSLTNDVSANFNIATGGCIVFSSNTDYGTNNGTVTNLGSGAWPWCGITVSSASTSFTNNSVVIDNGTIYNKGSFTNTTKSAFIYKANSGSITGTNYFVYKGDALLKYNGTSAQTTSYYEFPNSTSESPNYVIVDNSNGVTLDNARTINYNATFPSTVGAPFLTLTNGALNLNSNLIIINSPATNAITRTSGFILSNTIDQVFASKVQWNIGSTAGAHVFPFGVDAATYIPFTFNLAVGGNTGGSVTVSTYPTGGVTANDVFANKPAIVANLNGINTGTSAPANATYVVRRFWRIEPTSNPITGTATITFTYGNDATESPVSGESTEMIAQEYDITNNSWIYPELPGQTNNTTTNTVSVPSATTFSPWTLTQKSNPLPISLLSFDAYCNDGKVRISWSTATETNNDYFTLQRSFDTQYWQDIAQIKGSGNSNTVLNYQHTDENSQGGLLYYRLKQTDFDGHFEIFSPVSVVCLSDIAGQLTIYPNPFAGELVIQYAGMDAGIGKIRVTDMLGNIIAEKEIFINNGSNNTILNLQKEAAGLYNLEFITASGNINKRLLKK
jgi:hypothetical protein